MATNASTGAALVITLAFVVLLTTLVLAFLSYSSLQSQISSASANRTVVDIFTQGALNAIMGDLKTEIVSGSTTTNIGTNVIYFPQSPTNMVPQRIGTDDSLANLVKRSAVNKPLYSGGTSRAASVSTTVPSRNGRSISAARWNASLLLPKANANSATDLTPTNTFIAPDWVFVARNGSNPTSWTDTLRWSRTNQNTVIGRYAYTVYDEGGLLDMNSAGYPAGSSSTLTADKGGLAFADLTVIPGMSAKAINAVVGWRNYATSQPEGNFPSFTFNAASQTNYFRAVRESVSGFLRTGNTNVISSGQTDRMFVSRQQLIQFLTHGVAADDTERAALQNSLQYLSTFTRDLEQPSFVPDPNRPKNTQYWVTNAGNDQGGGTSLDTTGAKQDIVNPSLLTVRAANGEPVMKRRFPLSRLGLIKPNPSAEEATKIYDYFGLTWEKSEGRWKYGHGGTDGQIFSLKDIPASREPDFFETLRSVIHCDSLGKQHGSLNSTSGLLSAHSIFGAAIDAIVNYQILQIGVNLIDQYDADSYPTRVYVVDKEGLEREYYGIENLPYFLGWETVWYRTRVLTPGVEINNDASDDDLKIAPASGTYEVAAMLQPIIWNPHVADSTLNASTLPTKFRVLASAFEGDRALEGNHAPIVAENWWKENSKSRLYPAKGSYITDRGMQRNPADKTKAGTHLFRFPRPQIDANTSALTFNTGIGDADFREPYRLRGLNEPHGSNAAPEAGYAEGQINHLDAELIANGEPSPALGIFLGYAWAGPYTSTTLSGTYLCKGSLSYDLNLRLQYKNPYGSTPEWLTYDLIEQVYTTSGKTSTVDNTGTPPQIRSFRTCFRADPRTDRWGLFGLNTFPEKNAGDISKNPTEGLTPLNGDGIISPTTTRSTWPIYYLPQQITAKPTSTFSFLTGPSGATGGTAGWLSGGIYNVADTMVNLQTGTKTSPIPGAKTYYADPDGVIRRASGGNFSGNDGLPLYTTNTNSRPVVLNRPFRSVAEMGYASRGVAWRELEFFMPESGDAALLDAFCLNEIGNASDDVTVAGRVNLNTRQPKVLQALIQGVSKAEGGLVSDVEASAAAAALVNWTMDTTTATTGASPILIKGPLRNRSELVGKFISQVKITPKPNLTGTPSLEPLDPLKSYSGFSSMLKAGSGGVFTTGADAAIKRRRESVMRALTDAGNTRTWNLLIDIVAQTGRYPVNSTALDQFLVEGETRYWVHLAIDRYTGQVIAKQWEQVSE